jgi:hypothetical protein
MSLIRDTFTRTVTGGLGTADTGHVWAPVAISAADGAYSADGTRGLISAASGTGNYIQTLSGEAFGDVEVTASFELQGNTATTEEANLCIRQSTNAGVYADLEGMLLAGRTGPVQVRLGGYTAGTWTSITPVLDIGNWTTQGKRWEVRFRVKGSDLAMKAWPTGTDEPTAWQLTGSRSGIGPGTVGIRARNAGATMLRLWTHDLAAVSLDSQVTTTPPLVTGTARYDNLLVEVRDKALARLGALPGEAEWQISDVHLGLGVWEVRIPIEAAITPALERPGSGIIVTGPHGPLLSGPMTAIDYQATTTDPRGMVIVEGVSDAVALSDRRAWPDPTSPILAQTKNFDTRRGKAETVMHEFVNANLGPGARAERRVPGLVMGANAGRGPEVTWRARFETVGEILAKLGTLAGLGFRIIQRGTQLVFETYEPEDLRLEQRWSLRGNQLSGARIAVSAPTVTRPIAGGEVDGAEVIHAAPTTTTGLASEVLWGRRIETYIDGGATAPEAEQKGLTALADGAATSVDAQAVPMDDMAAGIDYPLGSLVAVDLLGAELATPVAGYTLKAAADGVRLGAHLGDPTKLSSDAWYSRNATIADRRMSELERITGRVERYTLDQTVTIARDERFLKIASFPADATTASFADAIVKVRIGTDVNARLRVRADATLELEDMAQTAPVLSTTTGSGGTDPTRLGSRSGPFQALLAPNAATGGTDLWLQLVYNTTAARTVKLQIENQDSQAGTLPVWTPAIAQSPTAPTGHFGWMGMRQTGTRSTYYPQEQAAVVSGTATFQFVAGPRVQFAGTIVRGIVNASSSNVVDSFAGYVGYGARPDSTLTWNVSDAETKLVSITRFGEIFVAGRANTSLTFQVGGMTYSPRR